VPSIDWLVSCPRSSSHFAADVGDKQATENKGLVSRICGSPAMANFRFGTLEHDHAERNVPACESCDQTKC
jgi:hypothetical protein